MNLKHWIGIGFCALTLGGCGGGTTGDNTQADTCMTGKEKGTVAVKMAFAQQMAGNVSEGFDLDGYTASRGDPKTCGHASFTSPSGTPGIDNAVSAVIPTINQLTNDAFSGELQDAINNGMLLFGIGLSHVDDQKNDGCVDLTFVRLTGQPSIGTDKLLDANQTFDTDHMGPVSKAKGTIKNGVLTAGPFELALPVRILDANFVLNVHNAHITMKLGNDNELTGVLGGGILVEDMLTNLMKYAIGNDLKKMLPDLLNGIADLDQDPMTMKCRQFSVAMTYTAKAAFINP